ncbi:MAG: EAL domain-containing protein [Desulfobacteraceae bacterium]|nr:EAL domain-containing protein [Desulfobacteraceae bacterium]
MKTQTRSIARITTLLVGAMTIIVSILVPAGYFLVSYQYMMGSLDTQAESSAQAITRLVMANPDMWRYEEVRLMEQLERRTTIDIPEARRIIGLHGQIIAESSAPLTPPVISRRHYIYDAGSPVAQIEITRSLDHLLRETIFVACGALLVGGVGYVVMRRLPLRAIQQTHQSLEESETRYRSLFESMKEGMALHRIIYDTEGKPVSFEVVEINPSCELILDLKRKSVIGMSGNEFFKGALMDYFSEIVHSAETGESLVFELQGQEKRRYFTVSIFSPDKGKFVTLIEDITERKKSDEQIQLLAYYDNLTGLPNRTLFLDRLNHALAGAVRYGGNLALLYLDLDGFKDINDTLGHAQGDLFLTMVSQRFLGCLRRSDTLARLGGDEFIVLISYTGEERNAAHLAQHLLEEIAPSFEISGREVYTTASIGISIYPDDGRDADTLLRCADMAMYAAKGAGRNGYYFYSQEMNRKAHERMELETSLRHALEREEFFLEFQPIINASRNCLVGAEALVRWQDPDLGTVMPDTFIHVAENSGLVIPLGEWVLRKACEKITQWREAGLPPVTISINVSGRQFEQRSFTDAVHDILEETGADARYIQLELTETSLMRNADTTVCALHKLKELDLRIVVDDFGTGYSSLGYLKNFPIDRIKIDRSFVMDIDQSQDDRSIVEAIIAMANKLNLQVVAEGVETTVQRDFLLNLGCQEMQGFLFHRPLSEDKFIALLRDIQLCSASFS